MAALQLVSTLRVASSAASVDLLVDGQLVGRQTYSYLDNAAFKVQFKNGSNLTAVCRDKVNRTVGSHSLIDPGEPAGISLTLDAPNPSKGTGSALLLDGQDTALIRAELVDARGYFIGKNLSTINVTFSVVSGPGRIIGSHNGGKCSSHA